MEKKDKPSPNILLALKYALYATIIFFLIGNPETYSKTQEFMGTLFTIMTPQGAITPYGFLFHSLLFFCVMAALLIIW